MILLPQTWWRISDPILCQLLPGRGRSHDAKLFQTQASRGASRERESGGEAIREPINAEITARLQATFSENRESDQLDRLLDDPDLRAMAYVMVTTFDRAGREFAEIAEKPELSASSKWMSDPTCYAGACRAVAAVLMGQRLFELEQLAERVKT
jgi:hypothetical protein